MYEFLCLLRIPPYGLPPMTEKDGVGQWLDAVGRVATRTSPSKFSLPFPSAVQFSLSPAAAVLRTGPFVAPRARQYIRLQLLGYGSSGEWRHEVSCDCF